MTWTYTPSSVEGVYVLRLDGVEAGAVSFLPEVPLVTLRMIDIVQALNEPPHPSRRGLRSVP